MKKPEISIIIPLYNKGKVIKRTVNSVLSQTYKDFELVIVNDGSTDNSAEIVKEISDERIRLIQQKNAGPSAARNTGVKNAQTDWIVFLDGDDELLPDALEHFNELRNNFKDVDIYNCRSYIRTGDKLTPTYHPLEGYVKNPLKECYFSKCMPGAGFSMYRKEYISQYPYDERLRRFEDAELLIRLLPQARVFSSKKIVQVHDINYAQASAPRKDIDEDYSGHLTMKGKPFWGKMCVYRTFLENREAYKDEMHRLYPSWYWRYDLLLLYKILKHFK